MATFAFFGSNLGTSAFFKVRLGTQSTDKSWLKESLKYFNVPEVIIEISFSKDNHNSLTLPWLIKHRNHGLF